MGEGEDREIFWLHLYTVLEAWTLEPSCCSLPLSQPNAAGLATSSQDLATHDAVTRHLWMDRHANSLFSATYGAMPLFPQSAAPSARDLPSRWKGSGQKGCSRTLRPLGERLALTNHFFKSSSCPRTNMKPHFFLNRSNFSDSNHIWTIWSYFKCSAITPCHFLNQTRYSPVITAANWLEHLLWLLRSNNRILSHNRCIQKSPNSQQKFLLDTLTEDYIHNLGLRSSLSFPSRQQSSSLFTSIDENKKLFLQIWL